MAPSMKCAVNKKLSITSHLNSFLQVRNGEVVIQSETGGADDDNFGDPGSETMTFDRVYKAATG